jgi:DNA-binding GntR family transcriptional regulator
MTGLVRAGRRPEGPPVSLRTQQAVDGISEMIVRRKLFPGQQIRQEELATILGMSKSPVREALRALEMEGLVHHHPNQGYFTARFSADDLRQIYLMRRALETEIYKRLPLIPAAELQALKHLNKAIEAVNKRGPIHDVVRLNREFHFRIFAASGLTLVLREVERLWQISDSYRSLYLHDSFENAQGRIVNEHDQMIGALADHDIERLITVADEQRLSGEERVVAMLGA